MATCEWGIGFAEMIRERVRRLCLSLHTDRTVFSFEPSAGTLLHQLVQNPCLLRWYYRNHSTNKTLTFQSSALGFLSIALGLCHRKQKSAFESRNSLSPKKEQHILLTGCVFVSLCVHKYHTANNYNNNSTKENENPQNIILFLITRMNQYNKLNYN